MIVFVVFSVVGIHDVDVVHPLTFNLLPDDNIPAATETKVNVHAVTVVGACTTHGHTATTIRLLWFDIDMLIYLLSINH